MPESVLLEVCAVSVDYAVAAQRARAARIELCSDLDSGGVTPATRLMEAARHRLHIPIHVLVRPRTGDFVYSSQEFQLMRETIRTAKLSGMDGVVLGILHQNFEVDVARTRELVELGRPLQVTFHRAFDQTNSWQDALEAVIQTGADRLLTSGCQPTVPEGLSTISQLVRAARDRIIVMPGGGITPANVVQVVRATSAREIHASLLRPAPGEAAENPQASPADIYHRRVLSVTSQLQSV